MKMIVGQTKLAKLDCITNCLIMIYHKINPSPVS